MFYAMPNPFLMNIALWNQFGVIVDSTDLASAELNLHGYISGSPALDGRWQMKLEAAQNVIFCKEVFSQVSQTHTTLRLTETM